MQRFLHLDYEDYAKNDLTLTMDECDRMFRSKLLEAQYFIGTELFVDGTSDLCDCALAALTDIVYDISPAIFFPNELWVTDLKAHSYYAADDHL